MVMTDLDRGISRFQSTVLYARARNSAVVRLVLCYRHVLYRCRACPIVVYLERVLRIRINDLEVIGMRSRLQANVCRSIRTSLFPAPDRIDRGECLSVVSNATMDRQLLNFNSSSELIISIRGVLFPSRLNVISLYVSKASNLRMLLTDVFRQRSNDRSSVLLLLGLQFRSCETRRVTAIRSSKGVITVLACLDLYQRSSPGRGSRRRHPCLSFVRSFFSCCGQLAVGGCQS